MSTAIKLIHSILGTQHSIGVYATAHAIEYVSHLVKDEHKTFPELRFKADIYPTAAAHVLNRRGVPISSDAAARAIQRTANLLWDAMQERRLVSLIYHDAPPRLSPHPYELVYQLALYYNEIQ